MARTYVNTTDYSLVLHELRKEDKALEFHPHARRNLEAEGYSEEDLSKSPGLEYFKQLGHIKVEDTAATQEIPKEVSAQLAQASKVEEPSEPAPVEPVPEVSADSAPAVEESQGEQVATEAPEGTKSSGRRGGRKPKES